MNRILTVMLIVLVSAASASQARSTVEGRVTQVRDGDTIVVAGVPIRLNGVDAPELGTRAGNSARAFMVRLTRGKTVTCRLNGDRTYDRWVGICFAEGQDIAAALIANGYALDCRRYLGGRYRSLEPGGARARLPQARYCR